MNEMKKLKVLIVEDSELQREWAKKELGSVYDLEFVHSRHEYWKKIKERGEGHYDYIMTDLIIPDGKGDFPQAHDGMLVLEKILTLFAQKNISGAALVSNFEHHAIDLNDEPKRKEFNNLAHMINERFGLLKILSQNDDVKIVIWADERIERYSHVYDVEEGIEKEIESIPREELIEGLKIHREKYILLKPWKEVLKKIMS